VKPDWAEFGYFLCYFKMFAPRALARALVFRLLVKGNKALGTRWPTMGNIGEIKLADLDAFEAVFQNEDVTKISHIADVTAEVLERIGIFYNFHVYQSVK